MDTKSPRVRFAPAPTGLMHLGNVRTALMNYLFARKKDGTFVLRIEDTDPQRNIDPQAKNIIDDLTWLNISFNEGPGVEGPYKPYFQSQRTKLYQEKLDQLKEKDLVYRCFCTPEELEKKRQEQISLKMPPRYDRTCATLSKEEIQERLDKSIPYIWRMKVDPKQTIEVTDLARGPIKFDLSNFSDFPLTRQDGSFTFIFANFVDDALMNMTHILRGEDHLTNTANQAVLYQAFDLPLPVFWHLPILCNINGKKLSKRDFGFSLKDLKDSGYLPEALVNYLAIIGGGAFEQEIMPLDELVNALDFENIHATGHVKYDVEKLQWLNHKWIDRYDPEKLTILARPFLEKEIPQAQKLDDKKLTQLLQIIKTDLTTLADVPKVLRFYFEQPEITAELVEKAITKEQLPIIKSILQNNIDKIDNTDNFINTIKQAAKDQKLSLKPVFSAVRLALTGSAKGPSVHNLIDMLGSQEVQKRVSHFIKN